MLRQNHGVAQGEGRGEGRAPRRRARHWMALGLGLGVFPAVAAPLLLHPTPAQAQAQVGFVWDSDGLRSLHFAVGHVYGIPTARVVHYAPTWLHPSELPVVHLVAREARVSPEVVIALRQQGWGWVDISYHLGLGPWIYVAHLPVHSGPPYGVAHGYWRKRGGRDYAYLTDRHVIDYVNVYLWAEYHRRPVTEVIVVRERYGDWGRFARSPSWRAVAEPPRTRPAQPRQVVARPESWEAPAPPRPAAPRNPPPTREAAPRREAAPSNREVAPRNPPPTREVAPRPQPTPRMAREDEGRERAAPPRPLPQPGTREAAPRAVRPEAPPARGEAPPARAAAPDRAVAPAREAAPARAAQPPREAAPPPEGGGRERRLPTPGPRPVRGQVGGGG
jgi:hypothetical protein